MDDLTELLKGVLDGAVMQILSRGPNYGYEIVRALNQAGFDSISEGTVYPILLRLGKRHLVSAEKARSELGPPRKVYTLNAASLNALARFWQRCEFVASSLSGLRTAGAGGGVGANTHPDTPRARPYAH